MTRRSTKLAWTLLIALGCVAAWLVLDRGTTPGLPQAAIVEDAPAPAAPPPQTVRDHADTPGTAPMPAEADTGPAPDAPAAPVAKPLPEESLWQPAYGDAVRRGGARANFALVDAQGAGLDSPRVSVMLHRALGPYWLRDHAEFNAESGVVECIGHSSVGLEPGEYELEVHDERYGGLRYCFTLARGQQLEQTLRLPNWRRIVTFRFVDQHGSPVPWIHRMPSVRSVADPLEKVDRTNTPGNVLREPPSWNSGGLGGRGGRFPGRARGSGAGTPFVVATDNGNFYVALIAGAQCEVQFPFQESLWGVTDRSFHGRFTEPQDGANEVPIELAEDFTHQVTRLRKEMVEDPGHRSLLHPRKPPPLPPDPTDASTVPEGMSRILVYFSGPAGVRPVATRSLGSAQDETSAGLTLRGNVWAAEVPVDAQVSLWFTDGALFQTRVQQIDLQGRTLIEIQRTVSRAGFGISPREWPPTVDAWALDQVQEVTNPAADRDSAPIRFAAKDHYVLCAPDRMADLEGAEGLQAASILAGPRRFTKQRPDLIPYLSIGTRMSHWWPQEWLHQFVRSQPLELAGADLVSGSFCPPVPQTGIAFRAIGPLGEGMPWVEASLLSLEEDQIAQAVREHEAAETRDQARPRVSEVPYEYYSRLDDAEADEDAPLTDVLPHLPEGMRGRLKARPELLWYARNGTWYSTHRKFFSDDHGYVVNTQPRLTPGTRYVLYLWSNSRDDMRPDRRIVFEAAPGLTDLGAIPLPGYTN